MKLFLNVETLKTLLKRVQEVRDKSSIDDIHASNDDAWDYVELTFNDSGFIDKKKKEHEEYDQVMIDQVKVVVKCETCNDEIVHL